MKQLIPAHEHILRSIIRLDKAKAFLSVEPFHRAGWHLASPCFAAWFIFRQPIRTIKCRSSHGRRPWGVPSLTIHGPSRPVISLTVAARQSQFP